MELCLIDPEGSRKETYCVVAMFGLLSHCFLSSGASVLPEKEAVSRSTCLATGGRPTGEEKAVLRKPRSPWPVYLLPACGFGRKGQARLRDKSLVIEAAVQPAHSLFLKGPSE